MPPVIVSRPEPPRATSLPRAGVDLSRCRRRSGRSWRSRRGRRRVRSAWPSSPRMASLPTPPPIRSEPEPPRRMSLPGPPVIWSSPPNWGSVVAMTESRPMRKLTLPLSPRITLLPNLAGVGRAAVGAARAAPPQVSKPEESVSLPAPPRMTSLPVPPSIVSLPPAEGSMRLDRGEHARHEQGGAAVARDGVVARAAGDLVGAEPAEDDVVARAAGDRVVAAEAGVGAREGDGLAGAQGVAAVVARDQVVARRRR